MNELKRVLFPAVIYISLLLVVGCSSSPITPTAEVGNSRNAETPQPKSTPSATPSADATNKKPTDGGYYLDDGPSDNPPSDINNIPNAVPKVEQLKNRSNQPYTALNQRFVPMTSYQPYKKQGVASWYGKRYHGRKTSSGEVYDMFGMTAAHPILPIPSYVKVTNVQNGAFVVVKVNDRGPFKRDRLIDLSYVAAHKLGIVGSGSGMVEVELIDPTKPVSIENAQQSSMGSVKPVEASSANTNLSTKNNAGQHYVQAGAFKSESNGLQLQNKMQRLPLAQNVTVTNVYNNGLYRVRLGPYESQRAADLAASEVRRTLDIPAIVTQQ